MLRLWAKPGRSDDRLPDFAKGRLGQCRKSGQGAVSEANGFLALPEITLSLK
jgi:hypothetical protein